MKKFPLIGAWVSLSLLTGCAASSDIVKTVVLPTSNKSIDVVLSRSDVKFLDCGTLVVLQTYSAEGSLIDSKEARGNALHCDVITAGIQAGGMVGAASVLRPAHTENNTSLSNEQSQVGGTAVSVAGSVSSSTAASSSSSNSSSSAKGGKVAAPKHEETNHSKPHGNNGYGNGGNDGSPNGHSDSDR